MRFAEDPKAMGANEAARNAFLDEKTATQRLHLQEARFDSEYANHRLALYRLEVEEARAMLRCLEVVVGAMVESR